MAGADWILRGRRVVLPEGIRPAAIRVRDGVIQEVREYDGAYDEDAGDLVVNARVWWIRTFISMSRPHRMGGVRDGHARGRGRRVTTLVDMPLNSIPATTSVDGYAAKVAGGRRQVLGGRGFWAAWSRGIPARSRGLLAAGCLGFKCFLTPSGVEGNSRRFPSATCVRRCRSWLAPARCYWRTPNLPAFLMEGHGDARRYRTYMESRPTAAENFAIELLIRLSRRRGAAFTWFI